MLALPFAGSLVDALLLNLHALDLVLEVVKENLVTGPEIIVLKIARAPVLVPYLPTIIK